MITPEKTIRRESLILRVLWMLLFLLVWQIAVPLLGVLVVAQLLYRLFYAAPSALLMSFGDSLSQYLAQIGRFALTGLLLPLLLISVTSVGLPSMPTTTFSTLVPPTPVQPSSAG